MTELRIAAAVSENAQLSSGAPTMCRSACPLEGCGVPYRMQAVDDPARKKDNPAPQWEVAFELIEWQPSYAQRGPLLLQLYVSSTRM